MSTAESMSTRKNEAGCICRCRHIAGQDFKLERKAEWVIVKCFILPAEAKKIRQKPPDKNL